MDLPLAGPYGWGDPTGTRTATYSTSAVGAPLALSVSPVQEGRTCDAVPPLTPAIEPCHLTCLFCLRRLHQRGHLSLPATTTT